MATRKIQYRTATLERPLDVPRRAAWAEVVAVTERRSAGYRLGPVGPVVETVLSEEPPWRLVLRVDGDQPSPLCQTSVTIRDDGDRCLVAWSCLVDPTGVEPGGLDGLVTALAADGRALLDGLAESVGASTG